MVESRTPPTPYRHPRRIRAHSPAAAGAWRRRRVAAVPEGHTLHRLARLPQRRYAGAPVAVSSPQGRFAADASAVDGRVLQRASAWGKHLFPHYVGGSTVHVHLGLYGTFTEWPLPRDVAMPVAVGQVRMRMVGAEYGTDLRGPTVCEILDDAQVADVVARLG